MISCIFAAGSWRTSETTKIGAGETPKGGKTREVTAERVCAHSKWANACIETLSKERVFLPLKEGER